MMTYNTIMKENEILKQLVPLLVEVLGVKTEAVRMESVLVSDLGAESIDLLDLSFRIEESFGVTLEANEMEQEARRRLPGGEFEKEGCITPEALNELRFLLPDVDPAKLAPGLRKADLPSLLTVGFFVHLIDRKLALKEAEPTHA